MSDYPKPPFPIQKQTGFTQAMKPPKRLARASSGILFVERLRVLAKRFEPALGPSFAYARQEAIGTC
ncbi:hypothetical protein [Bradyrhizobium sp. Leo170]|uniref:hypothetical protein n=1 Tax=Bradyrhizobium sp. Leo170 TaxID=1571199 RepID=UPI00102EA968|nr:hypothetical protein [Bradyrhizobium sp. Leo170]